MLLPAIGAGIGLLSNIFGSKKPQQTNTGLDPESAEYLRSQRGLAMNWANRSMPELDPAFMAALNGMRGYSDAGAMGMRAQYDPSAASQFMNPFMANMNPVFDRMRSASVNELNKRATAAGAFGARRGLAQGAAMRGVNDTQAQFNYQGFNDAMSRAMQLASMGMGANTWLGDAGRYMTDRQRNWDIGSMGILNMGMGPTGSTTTIPNESNMFESILGGAMTGASFMNPNPATGGGASPMMSGPAYQFDPVQFGRGGMYGFGNPWTPGAN